jgi:Predicted methyltransferase (contains TPR repeat)
MKLPNTLEQLKDIFDERAQTYGPSLKGVDWNSPQAQIKRFDQLLKVCDCNQFFTINDYGCGYGALAEYLQTKGQAVEYHGYDISQVMIDNAIKSHEMLKNCKFYSDESKMPRSDYTVASGVFNLKLETDGEEWRGYILETLSKIAVKSLKGFAFNMLTKYSDAERMRPDLYYGDPCLFFDYCKRHFSRNVALLHDYDLYDFTILVRL